MISVGRKIGLYSKALGLSLLVGLSSCGNKMSKSVNHIDCDTMASTKKIISMLERGDRESALLVNVPKGTNVIKANDVKNYSPNDSIGERFYEVYVGKADKAIRKAQKKKGDLVTVGQGITGLEYIKLAGGIKVYKGDYISSHTADSLLNEAIHEKDSILKANIPDSAYISLKQFQKDAIISYLYNVSEKILKKAPKGKSFFQYLAEKNYGMVQSKFNICPSSKKAEAGLAKRNLINLLIFGNGKVLDNKAAQDNFEKQVKKVKRHKNGKKLLEEVIDIVKKYNVDSLNLEETKQKMLY